jgi:hypothetical protein
MPMRQQLTFFQILGAGVNSVAWRLSGTQTRQLGCALLCRLVTSASRGHGSSQGDPRQVTRVPG